jgi:hypothetical protein
MSSIRQFPLPLAVFKICKSCKRELPIDDYGYNARSRYQIDYNCRECKALSHKCRTYSITPEQYFAMLRAQGGVCAICARPPVSKRDWHVDHDHKTGIIRGLLCNGCNTAIGQLRDNPALCRAAADYLERHGK